MAAGISSRRPAREASTRANRTFLQDGHWKCGSHSTCWPENADGEHSICICRNLESKLYSILMQIEAYSQLQWIAVSEARTMFNTCSVFSSIAQAPNTWVSLMQEILRYFGNVQDPLLEGARLLEQFQAQYVTALR